MSRFKILVLSTFLSLPVAALLWSDSQYLANAHDGHSKGHDHKGHDHKGHDHKGHDHKGHDHKGHDAIDNSTPNRIDIEDQLTVPKAETPSAPRNITGDENGREQSAPTSPVLPNHKHGEQTVRPQDLRVIAIRLEYAVEIIRDEIDFDVHCYDRDDLLDAASILEKDAQHFRAAVENRVDLQDMRLDFQRMTDSFIALANPLERHYGSILIDRAMSRIDRLLREVNRQMRNTDAEQPIQETHDEPLGAHGHSIPQPPAPDQTEGF